MSNINNQTQDLFAIDTVQDLSLESAAAVSGGDVVKTVTLHSEQFFKGRSLGTNDAIADLSAYRFNNITSSIQVQSGTWRFYTGKNFQGRFIELETETGLGRIGLDNQISSLRRAR